MPMPLRMNAMPRCLRCPLQVIPPTLVESAVFSFRNRSLNITFLSFFVILENNEAILQQSSTILGSAGATKNGGQVLSQRTAVQLSISPGYLRFSILISFSIYLPMASSPFHNADSNSPPCSPGMLLSQLWTQGTHPL